MFTEAGSKCDIVPTDSYVKKFSFKAKMSMFTVKIYKNLKKKHFGLSGHFIKVLQDDTPVKLGA